MQAPININKDRLAATFLSLVKIDSVSKEEGRLARWLLSRLDKLGARTHVDDAGQQVGGDSGNIIAHFKDSREAAPLLLCAHMDTVEPGRGVQAQLKEGAFSSIGDTILGADDKSAIAIILEVMQSIREQGWPCGPLEVVFTICEEVGLLGAKHLAYDRLGAKMGFVLDTSNPAAIVTRAPSANRLVLRVRGKAAHAGSSPEKGINAISLASKAIAQLEIGRLDEESTCNIGLIEGGLATNIVPNLVVAKGEVRSHDETKLQRFTDEIVATFEQVVGSYQGLETEDRPQLNTKVQRDFDCLSIDSDHAVVNLARRAAAVLNLPLETAGSGGGSDANIFAAHGITTGVLGTGMTDVHTVNESIRLSDMVRSVCLLMEIIRLHAEG